MTAYMKVDVTPDTPEWLAERVKTIGASEVAGIMGLSAYGQTPLSIYKGKLGAPSVFPPLLAFIGHASEQIIQEWVTRFAADEYPSLAPEFGQLRPGFMARSKESPWLHATFDRTSTTAVGLIPWQFKTAHHFAGHHWDEGVPVDVSAQVQAEMYVAGSPHAFVVVWIGGRDFKLFKLDRDQAWIENHLLPKVGVFYFDHLLKKIPPDPVTRAEVEETWPDPHGSIEADDDAFEWAEMREVLLSDKKQIEAQLVPIEVGIGKYMGENDTLTRDGYPILTYKHRSGARLVDREKLERDWPEAYADVLTFGKSGRTFRRVKPKEQTT